MFPPHCACGIEQTWDHGVEGLPLFKVDMNQTWNDLDKVIVILIPGAVRWIDTATRGEAEWLCFSVKSRGNVSIWYMNNLDGWSWFLLLLCLRSAFSLSSAPPPSPSLLDITPEVCLWCLKGSWATWGIEGRRDSLSLSAVLSVSSFFLRSTQTSDKQLNTRWHT